MVLSVSSGYSPDYLLKQVATGRENYYTGAVAEGEPPGRWWGAGAQRLGLAGLVEAQDMRAVYERFLDPRAEGFNDPTQWAELPTLGHTGRSYKSEDELYAAAVEREPNASAERRVELRTEAGKAARRNVAFYDVTFSVAKSVTLLHTAFEAEQVKAAARGDEAAAAAWGEYRAAVEEAIWAGNNAALGYLSERAGYSRVGHHGGAAGRYVDAHEWVVASFFQHDSRDHDPQLHIHNPILNRVQGPDGTWRTLDGRSLYRWRAAAGAVAERTTEERITHALGLRFATRPDGKAREAVGVDPAVMALISSRRRAVTAKAEQLIAAFETQFGRAPNNLERDRISRQATFATRRAKSHEGLTRAQLLARVDTQLRAEVAGGLAGVARDALAARDDGSLAAQVWSPSAVIETALADVQARSAGWTRSDLTRAINAALPDYLGLPDGTDVGRLLDQLTVQALTAATPLDAARPAADAMPDALRLANGDSAYEQPGGRLYATPEQVRTERFLVAATAQGGATALPREQARRFLDELSESGIELGADQAAAVRGVLTSGARIESLVGPAGTGKSFVVGAIARGWTSAPRPDGGPMRRVFGLATSQVATDVLTGEGLTARNVARWLATQDRLTAPVAEARAGDDDAGWALRAGDLVVVDESAMTDTAALAAIHKHVDGAGAKLLLVGDHRQLAAVGAGGGMDLLAGAGARYELADARRFTAGWERSASLRLRAGDGSVLRDYFEQGRILDAGTTAAAEQSAARAWLADTLDGRRSLLLVDTNDQAAVLSAQLRAELVRLGRVAEDGVPLGLQGTYAGVGDLVQARRNGWHLAGLDGNRRGPINRETYRVTATRPDGSLDVAPILGNGPEREQLGETIVLPAAYVGEHLALGYASTVHAVQGATVDTSHTVVTGRTGPAALYVGMSRGRASNTAHVATVSAVEDPANGRPDQTVRRHPVAMLAGLLDPDGRTATRSALAAAAESAAEAGSLRAAVELLADASQLAATDRTAGWLDQLTADGVLSMADRRRIAAEDGAASLTRILRRAELAGHDPRAVLAAAIDGRPLDGARNLTNVIHTRITDAGLPLDPVAATWAARVPTVDDPQYQRYLDQLGAVVDERAAALGAAAAADPPAWALEAFGAPPDDAAGRQRWQEAAAAVAAHRELTHDGAAREDEQAGDVLGQAPKPGQIEHYAAFRSAWKALGRPEIDRETAELSDGQLRMRIRGAARDETWAPRFVGNELAATRQAADGHRHRASLRRAEADAATDPAERARLVQEATDAGVLADTLDTRTSTLQELDDARARWLAHTAGNRAAADQARLVLADRQADTDPEPEVTAEEWLAAAREADQADDAHREITDTDLSDLPADASDLPERRVDDDVLLVETAVDDVRDAAVGDAATSEDTVRVPSADDVAASLYRAARSLREIEAREAAEQAEAADRAAELTRWHTDDADHHLSSVADEAGDHYTDALDPA